jgi:hypothetical protein
MPYKDKNQQNSELGNMLLKWMCANLKYQSTYQSYQVWGANSIESNKDNDFPPLCNQTYPDSLYLHLANKQGLKENVQKCRPKNLCNSISKLQPVYLTRHLLPLAIIIL